MEETDRKLMLLLYENPRARERELAATLGVSRQSIHRRLQYMTRLGLFKTIKAGLSTDYIGGVAVTVFGRSKTTDMNRTLDRLGDSDLTGDASVAGGNMLYVGGYLKNISELEGFAEFVKLTAEMPEATIAIPDLGDGINPEFYDGVRLKPNFKHVSPLELRIIAMLVEDARTPDGVIAKSLGVSSKTVRRHLEKMKSDGVLDYAFPSDISMGEDIHAIVHLTLRHGADKIKVSKRLYSIDRAHLDLVRAYSNLPDFLIASICCDKMTIVRKILAEIESDDDVVTMTPNFVYIERVYPTWNRRLTQDIVHSAERARARRPRPKHSA